MEFDYKWLEGEARDGFYVSSMMKRAWAAQLEMLQDIDEACQQNNIRYFADWGTLLGGRSDIEGLFHGMMIWISVCFGMILTGLEIMCNCLHVTV